MAERTVLCVKLHKELPGLDEPPFDTEFGKKIYENVSKQAWQGWTEFCKMLLNEYRLNPARREDQEAIVKQMERIFLRRRRRSAQGVRAARTEIAASAVGRITTVVALVGTVYRIVICISSSRNIPALEMRYGSARLRYADPFRCPSGLGVQSCPRRHSGAEGQLLPAVDPSRRHFC